MKITHLTTTAVSLPLAEPLGNATATIREFSCIVVTTNRPSGDQVTSICEPFHSMKSGAVSRFGYQRVAPL